MDTLKSTHPGLSADLNADVVAIIGCDARGRVVIAGVQCAFVSVFTEGKYKGTNDIAR